MGSGMSSRRGAGPLRGSSALLLGAVAAAGLLTVAHARGVERATDDLVADAREILHPAAAHEHDGVLLQVVALTRDVGRHLHPAGQPDTGDLAEGRVRLLGGVGVNARAHTTALRGALERRRLALGGLRLTAFSDELLDGGHEGPSCGCPPPWRADCLAADEAGFHD